MHFKLFLFLLAVVLLTNCARTKNKLEINQLDEIKMDSKTMIYNKEQSNFIEGTYINLSSIIKNLKSNSQISNSFF